MIRLLLCLVLFVSNFCAFAGSCEWGCDGVASCLAKCPKK